jgi:hypothetical protein
MNFGENIMGKTLSKILWGLAGLTLSAAVAHIIPQSREYSFKKSEEHNLSPKESAAGITDANIGEKYAVLINPNDKYSQFNKAQDFQYKTLRSLGFSDENIYVLQSGENLPAYVDEIVSRENVVKTFRNLKEKITSNDLLLIYVNNHGMKYEDGVPAIPVDFDKQEGGPRDGIKIEEFNDLCNNIKSKYTVAVFGMCFGGNFAKEVRGSNIITISSAAEDKQSFSLTERFNFDGPFFAALGGRNHSGKKVDADANKDGVTSWKEAFDYAADKDPFTRPWYWLAFYGLRNEVPQIYYQDANPNLLSINGKIQTQSIAEDKATAIYSDKLAK